MAFFNTRCYHCELCDITQVTFNFWGNALLGSISGFYLFGNCQISGNLSTSVISPLGGTGIVQLHYKLEFLYTEWWGVTFNCGSLWYWNLAQNSVTKEPRISNSWGSEGALRRLGV